MENLLNRAIEIKDEVIKHRRTLHKYPEIGFDLEKTTAYVKEKLVDMGYEPIEICKGGVVAIIKGDKPGKTFLLRADMDALPMKESTDLEYKSTNEYMHSCGHDLHTAMLLGAAKLLKEYKHEIEGTVKLMFQPSEETFEGAKAMIDARLLENPKVDGAMGIHVLGGTAPSGTILYDSGAVAAGCTRFKIEITGKGSHGAIPEAGVDPINIGCHVHIALQEIISREISAQVPVVISIGKFVGGDAANIIPNNVIMEGTIRMFSKEIGDYAFNRISEIAKKTADLFRGKAKVTNLGYVPPVINEKETTNLIAGALKDVIGEYNVVKMPVKAMGSEDFSFVGNSLQSTFFSLGAGTKEDDERYSYPQHHPMVDFYEDCMVNGVVAHVCGAITWLKNNN